MIMNFQSFYDKAKQLGLSPYQFDNRVVQYDVFNMKNGHVKNVNQLKYMVAAKKVIKEISGK